MSGLRVLGILILLLPAAALACRRMIPTTDWTEKTPDGRFELIHKFGGGGGARVALRDAQKDGVLWEHPLNGLGESDYFLIAPDGSAVLYIEGRLQRLTLYGRGGEVLGPWSLEKMLTRSEFERLPRVTACEDLAWMDQRRVEGNAFTFVVTVRDAIGDFTNEARHIAFELSMTGELKRTPSRVDGTPSELIQRYNKERSPLVRLQIADELWMASKADRTQLSAELPAFWLNVLKDPATPRAVLTVAVAGLDSCGSDADLRSLLQLSPGVLERDIAILQMLAQKLPEEAGAYAVRMLERPQSSLLVRSAAFHHLLDRGGTAAQLANDFLQRDATLRAEDASRDLFNEFVAIQNFWQAFPFCADPTEQRKAMAARALHHLIHRMGESSAALLDLPDTVEASLKSDCPGVLLSLGMLAERHKDTTRASRLYSAGLAGLATASAEQQKDAQVLMLEAKLRLAVLSQGAELQRLVREVLADPSRSTEVCLARPFVSAQYWNLEHCQELKPAELVARQLLREARSQGPKRPPGAN